MTQSPGSAPVLPEILRPPLTRNVALLLDSRIPARMAWVSRASRPRIVPMWFHWTGTELVMVAFTGAAKLEEIADGDEVAASIDTETFPYRGLRLRGPVALESSDGLRDEYRVAAARVLGPSAGDAWCRSLEGRAQVAIRMAPRWAADWDMYRSPFLAEAEA